MLVPGREGSGQYKQETLVRDLLGEEYEAHNGLADVKALQKLVQKVMRERDAARDLEHQVSFTLDHVHDRYVYRWEESSSHGSWVKVSIGTQQQ